MQVGILNMVVRISLKMFRNSYPGVMLPGMTFTIEPGVSEGSPEVMILEDRWTAVSPDNSRSAQFEHTVLVTETGLEILTVGDDE